MQRSLCRFLFFSSVFACAASAIAQPPPPGPGRGRFPFPPPPILSAIDQDQDGEISADEMKMAAESLKKLDKNGDGEIADRELIPDFSGGRRGGFFGADDPNAKRLAPDEVEFKDGTASIPDHATFQMMSYKGDQVMIDTFLAGLEFVKFTIDGAPKEDAQLYFINTQTHRAHMMFARAVGLPRRGRDQMKGVLVYRPMLKSPAGNAGLYTFEFEPFDTYSFDMVKFAQDKLVEKMPALKGNIGYYPRQRGVDVYEDEKQLYADSEVTVYLEEDLNDTDIAFLPLNLGESFGKLRLMQLDEQPTQRDIVICDSLPNEMPRVAGIITAVRQTPLSHVNLRAIQDQVPNAFLNNAAENQSLVALLGKFVYYQVTEDGYKIREATSDEVDSYFSAVRPQQTQVLKCDLSAKDVRALDDIDFDDAASVGVKAANLATMRSFGFPDDCIPSGHAVPFYFYDEFMKHNGFYDAAANMMADEEFQSDVEKQELRLANFRTKIQNGKMPDWMMDALDRLHKLYPAGTSLRCRSSTNNEDLPGFSGAGLYSSYTHKPDEGQLAKTIKQVYASLWNYRAFEEREFYRVDHTSAAMAVLVHPNSTGELANGVAVTDDILYQTAGNYYVNTQVGEDMVTNPEEKSVPEEVLLDWYKSEEFQVKRASNRVATGETILASEHLDQLRDHLGKIHGKFARRYGKSMEDDRFAMEIEFKITSDGKLLIKQARPWVYAFDSQE